MLYLLADAVQLTMIFPVPEEMVTEAGDWGEDEEVEVGLGVGEELTVEVETGVGVGEKVVEEL